MVLHLSGSDSEYRRLLEQKALASLSKVDYVKKPTTYITPSPRKAPTPARAVYSTTRVPTSGAAPFVRRSEPPSTPLYNRQRLSAPLSSNCYQCGKPGHYKDQCPQNLVVKAINGVELEEEEV
jgi:hypothetical protein